MTRRATRTLATLAATAALGIGAARAQIIPPTFETGIEIINLSLSVTDADSNATVTLLSVTSNGPDSVNGGDQPNDIVIVDEYSFQLRAERLGGGDGRVYTITYEVTDECGNSTVASATVTVPHDQGN